MDGTLLRLVLVPFHLPLTCRCPVHPLLGRPHLHLAGLLLTIQPSEFLDSAPDGAGTGYIRIAMPGLDNFLPARILHVSEEMHHTTDDRPDLPRHCL